MSEIPTEKEKIITINDTNHQLHGDWLLVTRRKKTPNHPSLNVPKIANQKSNRFNALSTLAHQSKSSTSQHHMVIKDRSFLAPNSNHNMSDEIDESIIVKNLPHHVRRTW